jgi:hypothetical protein
MVEQIERNVEYATWRTDKPKAPGCSHELVANTLHPKYYDDMHN